MVVKAYIFEGIGSGFGYYQEEKLRRKNQNRSLDNIKIVVQAS